MNPFQLPETLPATVAELDVLLDQVKRQANVLTARNAAGDALSAEDVAELNRLLDCADTLKTARTDAQASEESHAADVDAALARADAVTAEEPEDPAADAPEVAETAETAEDAKTPEVPETADEPAGDRELVTAAAGSPGRFARLGVEDAPPTPEGPGWEMDPGCPGFRTGMGLIGFADLARSIDSVRPGSRKNQPNTAARGAYSAQVLARLSRGVELVEDSHALVAAINKATSELPGQPGKLVDAVSLTAAGGWCAPSEQLYTFCDVPNATDLVSLPEITINRGGIRWPVEPDLSTIFENFEWFFTEPELEAVSSGDGTPSAVKTCVEIPCPDEFEEIRLNAVGYCVEAGILQTQGWPELIEWFMRSLTQEHLRALSRRTILDMVGGSTGVALGLGFGTVSSILNSLALAATNLRLDRGLSRNATIEGVAPSWFHEVLRADLAMMEGLDTKAVGDGQISGWLTSRNLAFQFVGDWQTRGAGEPGNMNTTDWPASVDLLLYPAGTWFRSMSPVIEFGVMYPRELLQVNRYTRFFTEDAIAVGKRCNRSLVVTVPICVSGAISDRVTVDCGSSAVAV